MKIFAFLDSTDKDLQKRAEKELKRLVAGTTISIVWSLYDGFSKLEWARETAGEYKGQDFPTTSSIDLLLSEAIARIGYKPDVVMSVINRDSFKGIYWGLHSGYRPQGVQMCFAKSSDRMEDTIGHELAHTFNDIIGDSKLNELFDVKNYDLEVVHKQSNARHWREILLKVYPYLNTDKSKIISLLQEALRLLGLYKTLIETGKQNVITMTKSEQLYEKAISLLGTDASPRDIVSDSVGCAETLSTIIRSIDQTFPVVTGTWTIWDLLRLRPDFHNLDNSPQKGDIILSPTGMGNGKISNGHTGIVGENGIIMSNDSKTGKFLKNYTLDEWAKYYGKKGGYPIYFFRWI